MTTVSDEKPRATLIDKQARGGVIGGKGYGFQAAYIVSCIPLWLADPDFAQFLQEGAGDVDVRFNRPGGEERWYVQVKNHEVEMAEARDVLAQFRDIDAGSPDTFSRFVLACPWLHDDLKRLRVAIEEWRELERFYEQGQEILDNTWADLESLVHKVELPADAAFLVSKVHFDTDLPDLTDGSSVRRSFVESLRDLETWAGLTREQANRACEKVGLLCHRALRQTCSREQVETLIQEAIDELPAKPAHAALTPSFIVPFMRNPDFVGREEDLKRLHQALMAKGPVGIRPAGLTGMAGIGKTQLAVEYAHDYAEAYPDGVFWINAAEPLTQGFAQLSQRLQPATADRTPEEQVRAAAFYLRDHPDALLILDNLADPSHLNGPVSPDLVPAGLPCHILFTTRRRDLGHFQAIEVTVLPEDAALQLLLCHSSRQPILNPIHPEHKEAKTICAVLGYLPLALEVAATHLGRRPDAPLASYRKELLARGALPVLDDPRLLLRPEDLPTRHSAAVAATLASQWENVENDDARLLLRVAGQLPEAAMISTARLGLLARLDDREGGFFGSPLKLALQELTDASLVEELRGKYVRLHPLVREFAAGQTPEEETPALRRWCATNLATAYEDIVTLENQCANRGIDALQEDLITALDLLIAPSSSLAAPPSTALTDRQEGGETRAWEGVEIRLQSLLRLLQREAYNLRNWNREQHQAFFAQQIYNRAVDMGPTHLATAAADHLERLGQPYLMLLWRAGPNWLALERILGGHEGTVHDVVVSPDGRRLLSASGDYTVRVWDLRTGQALRTLMGHKGWVNAVAVTPDGLCAISACADHNLVVWDLQKGQILHVLTGHEGPVNDVVVTPDGRHAISASADYTLKMWDLQTGQVRRTFRRRKGWVNGVAITPDGHYAVSACGDHVLVVWDLQTGQVAHTLVDHSRPVNAVAVTPDGRYAISACADHTLKVWDWQKGEAIHTLTGHEDVVNDVVVTPDGRHAISAGADRALRMWDLETGQPVSTFAGQGIGANAVTVTPDNRRVIYAAWDNTIKVWNLQTMEAAHTVFNHVGPVNTIAVPDNRQVISASADNTLKIWDLQTGQILHTLTSHRGPVNDVAVTLDSCYAISACADCTLKVWDLRTGQAVHTLARHLGPVNAVAVTPDGHSAISASADHNLAVWDLQTGQIWHILTGHEDAVNDVVVTPDGRYAISACADHTLKVWDWQKGEAIHTLTGHDGPVNAVVIIPHSRRVLSASADRSLRVWDLETGQEVCALVGHSGPVNSVVVTPDGHQAVSASDECTLIVWDLRKGQALRTLAGHEDRMNDVVVSCNGHYAISASSSILRVWNAQTGKELARVALDEMLLRTRVAPDGLTILAGDLAGSVYCLRFVDPKVS
jgi:WD40 repeat protein